MDVFKLRNQVIGDYRNYVKSFINIGDPKIERHVDGELQQGFLWPEPLVQLNPNFEPGESLETLVRQDVLHPECLRIFAKKDESGAHATPIRLHRHQVEGIKTARAGKNYVLTTGTGSGKSLSYIVPIVDYVLRNRGTRSGIQAIIVYPMNALANSQEGELEKFLCHGYPKGPPVSFRRYTGQEKEIQRKDIINNPPDILLTNYVMLELLLTRTLEDPLIKAARGLRFLVLDELHTYRGRQGADVAMLARRVREACEAHSLVHIGTSATLAGEGTWADQQKQVAHMASDLFGSPVESDHIIGETLRRVTPPPPSDLSQFFAEIRQRIESHQDPPAGDSAAFLAHPLSSWIESNLGLHTEAESGRHVRQKPMPIHGPGSASEKLCEDTDLDPDICRKALEQALLAGYQCKDEEGRPIFAFRLHQFISKGEKVYASLEPENTRYITLQAQQFVPGSERSKILLPLVFCRECGEAYYLVQQIAGAQKHSIYRSGELSDDELDESEGKSPEAIDGYLYVNESKPWPKPSDTAELLKRLPDTWIDLDKNNQQIVRKTYKDKLPREVFISPLGEEGKGKDALRAHFIQAPFRFCLQCGVAYDHHQRLDFAKVATLGSEGRSTATTILSLSTVRRLRQDPSLETEARKLLSFTDNRQDASLQAGHLNDFVEIALLRSALLRAVQAAGPEGIRHEELTRRVFDTLALPLHLYAWNPEVEYTQRDNTERALRQVLGYFLYQDLRRGWRITSPNLEQCGLLDIDYVDLKRCCADEPKWEKKHPVLAGATPEEREKVCRVLLDSMRRELCIRVDYLDPSYQEGLRESSRQYLIRPWSLDEQEHLEPSRIVFPRARGDENKSPFRWYYISPRSGFGLYLKRNGTFQNDGAKLNTQDIEKIIQELLKTLIIPGIVHEVVQGRAKNEAGGYQLNASALIWKAGDAKQAFHDWVRVPNPPSQGLRVNPFFGELYRQDSGDLKYIEAREHTAQVSNDDREEREKRFRDGKLPLLYCSPTMELGVDIRTLNVVNMRNIPPTPANYAQRSGRAGRSGQPAFVFTYCSSGSPHDQYFFKRPQQMVSGAVSTPRIDLLNEDLLRAHVHAVWLRESKLDLKHSLGDILDISGEEPTLDLLPSIRDKLETQIHRDRALVAAKDALGPVISRLIEPQEGVHEWIDRVLRELPHSFVQACERWKGLYRSALRQSKEQSRIVLDASKDSTQRARAAELRREAENQLRLLIDTQAFNSDFYSYRYFACEGFLPGYNFPRLPLSAYLSGRNRRKDRDEQLNRPRFLAISEFGPKSIIYHEGSRYSVNKIIMPVDRGEGIFNRRASLCGACGYLHPVQGSKADDTCDRCGQALPSALNNLFGMQHVSALRRARINSDEEERVRIGYEIKTGVRFAERGGALSAQKAQLISSQGQLLATLTYGHSATLWRMNLGWRRRKDKAVLGYLLDTERGHWADKSSEDPEENNESPVSARVERVIPYVEDHRNCLLIQPEDTLGPELMASLEYALKSAMQVEFQLEDRELASEALPNEADRRLILFYEASEGGAGVLRRIVEERGLLCKIVRNALDICHYHPDSGKDLRRAPRSREDCESACYDCLLSYFNQRHHSLLDRTLLPELLLKWRDGEVECSPAPIPRAEQMAALEKRCQSELERRWLHIIERMGLRLPSHAQYPVPNCSVRLDFAYVEQHAAIFIDGPHHDFSDQQAQDKKQEEALVNQGWSTIRFHHAADWASMISGLPNVFGRPTAPAQLPASLPSAPQPPASELQGFGIQWQPLLQRIQSETGARIETGQEIQRGGRILGETLATLKQHERALHLIDASQSDSAELVRALESKGQRVLRIRPDMPELIQRIQEALKA